MFNRIKQIMGKNREIVSYLFFGVATTLVNWVTYSLLVGGLSLNMTISNAIAWVVAVIFAFITNKLWVFLASDWRVVTVIKEGAAFVGSRAFSGAFEIISLPILVRIGLDQKMFGVDGFVAKVFLGIVVIILNYIFSKFFVFKADDGKNSVLARIWERLVRFSDKHKRLSYYLLYTAVFVITASIVFSWFFSNRRSFVWAAQLEDGLSQHYNALIYYGNYLRGVIGNFVSTGSLSFPLWDFSLGYGSDVLTTLNYYVIGDPLTLLSVFVPAHRTEILYILLIIFRLYLAGAFFSAFCNMMGRGRFATLCGALTYVFCGYVLVGAVRHPFFVGPMVYLPLILIAVEKIFKKERPYLFVIMIFISAISNFYFLYMLGFVVLIYAVIRMHFLYKGKRIVSMAANIGKMAGLLSVGILMSAFILLPNLMEVFSTLRMGEEKTYDLFYDAVYYQRFLSSFISNPGPGSWTVMAYSGIMITAVVVLFTLRKKYTQLKVGFIFLTLMLMFPIVGHIMNGFSYISNRWIWGYSFLVSLILVFTIPSMLKIGKRQLAALSATTIIYLAICMLMRNSRTSAFLASFSAMLLFVTVLCLLYILNSEKNVDNYAGFKLKIVKNKEVLARLAIVFFVVAGIVINAGYQYSFNESNYIEEFTDGGTYGTMSEAYQRMFNTSAKAVSLVDDDEFFRYDENKYGQLFTRNAAINNDVNSTSYYFSLANPNIATFMREIALDNAIEFEYVGTDNRAVVSSLASSKYFVVDSSTPQYVPYGYRGERALTHYGYKGGYGVYENEHSLPLGYTYTSVILRDEYEKLSPLEKQQTLPQMAVVDGEEYTGDLEQKLPEFDFEAMEYSITPGSGVEYHDGKFIVKSSNSRITLNFEGLKNSETYLFLENLYYHAKSPVEFLSDEERYWMTAYDRNRREAQYKYWTEPNNTRIVAEVPGISKSVAINTESYTYYDGRHDFLINLNYNEEARDKITLHFAGIGEYTFDDIKVLCQPMDRHGAQIEDLKEDVMENITIGENAVYGTISLSEPKLLNITIPYNGGWTAYVNGVETEIIRSNTMYSGLNLEAGDYDIELYYMTPWLKEGILCTAVGFTAFVALIILNELKIRKRRRE